jgi:hypothetical protein
MGEGRLKWLKILLLRSIEKTHAINELVICRKSSFVMEYFCTAKLQTAFYSIDRQTHGLRVVWLVQHISFSYIWMTLNKTMCSKIFECNQNSRGVHYENLLNIFVWLPMSHKSNNRHWHVSLGLLRFPLWIIYYLCILYLKIFIVKITKRFFRPFSNLFLKLGWKRLKLQTNNPSYTANCNAMR